MTTSTIIRLGDEVEITVFDAEGNVVERVYGSIPIDLSRFDGIDLARFGWDGQTDTFTIGELPPG